MRFTVLTAALVASACGSTAAMAQSPWYVSGNLGGYLRQDSDRSGTFTRSNSAETAKGNERLSYNPGVTVNAAVGYRLTSRLRLEGEVGYTAYGSKSLNPSTSNPDFPELNGASFKRLSGGDLSRVTETAGAFYDLAARTPYIPYTVQYIPYVGAGGGAAETNATDGVFATPAGTPFNLHGGPATVGLLFAEAGVGVTLSPHWSIVPAYRYVHFFGAGQDAAHVVKLGLRYAF